MRTDLLDAMKGGRSVEVKLLREFIAAIDNAEAPAQSASYLTSDQHSFESGSAEIARLSLGEDRVRALLAAEIEERKRALLKWIALSRANKMARHSGQNCEHLCI